jgi:hypothetical protein
MIQDCWTCRAKKVAKGVYEKDRGRNGQIIKIVQIHTRKIILSNCTRVIYSPILNIIIIFFIKISI